MTLVGKKDAILLLFGDIASFVAALWIALFVRYAEVPSSENFFVHVEVFAPVFFLWVLVFFISGYYDKQTTALKRKIPETIFRVSIINSVLAFIVFYLFPTPSVTPKINLLLCVVFSLLFVFSWRMFIFDLIKTSKIGNVLIIGKGKDIDDIRGEIEKNKNYGMFPFFADSFDDFILQNIKKNKISTVIADMSNLSEWKRADLVSRLIFSGVNLMNAEEVYENIFDKIPLSFLSNEWFLQNKPNDPRVLYDMFKRGMDLVVALVLGVVSLILYPFVYLAIKFEDGGPVLFKQDRIGQNGETIKIIKFRTMKAIDEGKWVTKDDSRITKVGNFLRRSRIDELPQLWNVIKGDISLIGPRPEILKFVELYEKEIPFYNMRHLIKPGLSGWAQIHHEKPPQSVEETREKLAYDLYYVKNRSIMLDIEIALKTIKTLLSRTGM